MSHSTTKKLVKILESINDVHVDEYKKPVEEDIGPDEQFEFETEVTVNNKEYYVYIDFEYQKDVIDFEVGRGNKTRERVGMVPYKAEKIRAFDAEGDREVRDEMELAKIEQEVVDQASKLPQFIKNGVWGPWIGED